MTSIAADDGARLHYRVDGPRGAPPVLFLNPIGTDVRIWAPQAAVLGEHVRVIRFDTRGIGRSDGPPGPYSMERLALDALAILDALDVERAHVCGLSLGGLVALQLAINHRPRIGRAVFANTAARVGTAALWDAQIAAMQASGAPNVEEIALATFLSDGFRQRRPEAIRLVRDMLSATSLNGYLGCFAALRDADLRHLASTVACRSLVIGGELDQATPPALAEDLHAAIVPSELVVIPGVGHLSNLEAPGLFSRRVLQHLADA
jgi:3-oxoadipate enol-lactonase